MKPLNYLTKKYGKYSLLLVLTFLLLPTILALLFPSSYNPFVQILFDFMLFGASLWFGVSVSNVESEKKASEKWLIAAETSCRELLTMSENARRMRMKQGKICESLDKIIPGIPQTKLEATKSLIGLSCNGCAGNLADLQNHIDNIYQNWSVFINANCSEEDCKAFHDRMDARKCEIKESFENQPD